MRIGFAVMALVFIVGGYVLSLVAYRFRTEESPKILSTESFHPKNWRPVWMLRGWFKPKGYVLNLTGVTMMVVGGVISAWFVF